MVNCWPVGAAEPVSLVADMVEITCGYVRGFDMNEGNDCSLRDGAITKSQKINESSYYESIHSLRPH